MVNKENTIAIILITILLVALIIYFIILFECYKSKSFIFAEYKPLELPNSFHPLGKIRKLTQQEINERNALISKNL